MAHCFGWRRQVSSPCCCQRIRLVPVGEAFFEGIGQLGLRDPLLGGAGVGPKPLVGDLLRRTLPNVVILNRVDPTRRGGRVSLRDLLGEGLGRQIVGFPGGKTFHPGGSPVRVSTGPVRRPGQQGYRAGRSPAFA